jgi:hypothetical protein
MPILSAPPFGAGVLRLECVASDHTSLEDPPPTALEPSAPPWAILPMSWQLRETYRSGMVRMTFPGIRAMGVKTWEKRRKNRGHSESSPECLNAVNPAVGLSAPK